MPPTQYNIIWFIIENSKKYFIIMAYLNGKMKKGGGWIPVSVV